MTWAQDLWSSRSSGWAFFQASSDNIVMQNSPSLTKQPKRRQWKKIALQPQLLLRRRPFEMRSLTCCCCCASAKEDDMKIFPAGNEVTFIDGRWDLLKHNSISRPVHTQCHHRSKCSVSGDKESSCNTHFFTLPSSHQQPCLFRQWGSCKFG